MQTNQSWHTFSEDGGGGAKIRQTPSIMKNKQENFRRKLLRTNSASMISMIRFNRSRKWEILKIWWE